MPSHSTIEDQYADLSEFFIRQQRTFVMWVNSKLMEGGESPVGVGPAAPAAFRDGTVFHRLPSRSTYDSNPIRGSACHKCHVVPLQLELQLQLLALLSNVVQVVGKLLMCLTSESIRGIDWGPKNPLVISANWSILFKVKVVCIVHLTEHQITNMSACVFSSSWLQRGLIWVVSPQSVSRSSIT